MLRLAVRFIRINRVVNDMYVFATGAQLGHSSSLGEEINGKGWRAASYRTFFLFLLLTGSTVSRSKFWMMWRCYYLILPVCSVFTGIFFSSSRSTLSKFILLSSIARTYIVDTHGDYFPAKEIELNAKLTWNRKYTTQHTKRA